MSRLMLFVAVSWLMLSLPIPGWADDAEDKAVAFVEKLGGTVTRDEKLPSTPVIEVNLATLEVNSSPSKVTDRDVKELTAFKSLTSFQLSGRRLTAAGLKELGVHKSLTTLWVGSPQVTDTGFMELAALKNLTLVWAGTPNVTDVGMKELEKALPNCRIFRFPTIN